MSKRHVQYCSCGEKLSAAGELEEGTCLTCLLRKAIKETVERIGPKQADKK